MQFPPIDFQPARRKQSRSSGNSTFVQFLGGFYGARDKTIAQPPDAPQHGRYIADKSVSALNAKFRKCIAAIKGIRRLNQCLGRHATYPGTNSAPRPVINDNKALRAFSDFTQRGKPGASRPDNCNIQYFTNDIFFITSRSDLSFYFK